MYKSNSYGQNGCRFRNVCGRKWQEILRSVTFRELENYDHSIKNTILRKATKQAKTKIVKKHLNRE